MLPWNRGMYPNFWSHIENTPSGVSIHYIDCGIDTGDIITQKQLSFSDSETLESSYRQLSECVENLFIENWDDIKHKTNKRTKQAHRGTFHTAKQTEAAFGVLGDDGWAIKIGVLKDRWKNDNR